MEGEQRLCTQSWLTEPARWRCSQTSLFLPRMALLTLQKGYSWFFLGGCLYIDMHTGSNSPVRTSRLGNTGAGSSWQRALQGQKHGVTMVDQRAGHHSSALHLQHPDTQLASGLAHGIILCHITYQLTHKSQTRQE